MKSIYKLIIHTCYSIGILLAYIISYRLVSLLRKIRDVVYSGWIAASLGSVKSKPGIEFPIMLIGNKYIKIGRNFSTRGRLRMEAFDTFGDQKFTPEIIIGDHVCFNYDCHIGCINKIIIGDHVLIGSRVLIIDHAHGASDRASLMQNVSNRNLISRGPVIIENNVWIGEGVAIMPNVIIGENAIIGANAVITHNVPPNTVVAGIPGKVIKNI